MTDQQQTAARASASASSSAASSQDHHHPAQREERALSIDSAAQQPSPAVTTTNDVGKKEHWLKAEASVEIPDNKMWIVLPGLMLCVFLAAMDQTIVTTALPTISAQLHADAAGYQWVGTAYLLTSTALIPLNGRLSDLVGRKPLLFASIALFLFGSALCGAAQNIVWLCVARGIQGAGGGGIMSMVMIVLGDITTLQKRAAYTSFFGLTWGLSSVLGPLVGGALTDRVTWRWCFFINLPTGGAAFVILLLFLNLKPHEKRSLSDIVRQFDFFGLFLIIAAAVLFLIGFSNAAVEGWQSAQVIACIAVGGALFLLFGFWETQTKRLPIISPRIFRTRTTAIIMISVFFHGFTFFAGTYYLPLYYQAVHGSDALLAGVQMLPFSLIASIMSVASGLTIAKTQAYRPLLWAGFSIMVLGFGLMTMLDDQSSVAVQEVLPAIAALGIGCLFQTPLIALQSAMPLSEMGSTTAAMQLVRSLAGTMGISIGGTILNSDFAARAAAIPGLEAQQRFLHDPRILKDIQPQQLAAQAIAAYAQSIRLIWIVCTPMAGVALIGVLFVKGYSLKRRQNNAGAPAAAAGDDKAQPDEKQAQGKAKGDGGDDDDIEAQLSPSADATAASRSTEQDEREASSSSPMQAKVGDIEAGSSSNQKQS